MSKITAERFKKALSNNSMKQIDLVEKTNFNRSAISQYVSGKVIPKDENLQILAKVLNVNEAWLLGYDVPMEFEETIESHKLSSDEKKLLSIFSSLSIVGKAELLRRGNELTRLSEFMEE